MFDMQKIMKQAKQMQDQINEVQEKLGDEEVTGTAGGGAVTVTADGRGDIKDIKISKEAAEDVETLQDLILAALKDAQNKANELAQEKMGGVTQGMNLNLPPGLKF